MKPLGRLRLRWLNYQVNMEKNLGWATLPIFVLVWAMMGVMAYMYGWGALIDEPTMLPFVFVMTFWGLERSWWARYVGQLRNSQSAEIAAEHAPDSSQ